MHPPIYGYSQKLLRKEGYHRYSRNSYQLRAELRLNQKRSKNAKCLLLIAVIIAVISFGYFFVSAFMNNDAVVLSKESKSTPQNEWHQGIMPYLYQTDVQWANHPYATTTFKESGCGPISLTMVNIFLTGDRSLSPTDMADIAEASGYSSADGTSWAFMSRGASNLGLQSEQIVLDKATVRDHLNSGRPIICIMGKGDFTTTGHFIVLCGITEDGLIIVRDSNSVERSLKPWSLQTIQKQCKNAWVYWV